jgi:hypothetical protein
MIEQDDEDLRIDSYLPDLGLEHLTLGPKIIGVHRQSDVWGGVCE